MLGENCDAAIKWQAAAAAAAVAATAAGVTEAEQTGRTTWVGKHGLKKQRAASRYVAHALHAARHYDGVVAHHDGLQIE